MQTQDIDHRQHRLDTVAERQAQLPFHIFRLTEQIRIEDFGTECLQHGRDEPADMPHPDQTDPLAIQLVGSDARSLLLPDSGMDLGIDFREPFQAGQHQRQRMFRNTPGIDSFVDIDRNPAAPDLIQIQHLRPDPCPLDHLQPTSRIKRLLVNRNPAAHQKIVGLRNLLDQPRVRGLIKRLDGKSLRAGCSKDFQRNARIFRSM